MFLPRLVASLCSFRQCTIAFSWPWRGAPLLPTRPKGTGHASLSSGCHHATAVAQSSPGDVGSPAFAADDSSEDALAVHNARIRKDARSCTTMCAGAPRPPAHPAAYLHAQGMQAASTAGARQRPGVEARLAQGQASHVWCAAAGPSRRKGPSPSPRRGGRSYAVLSIHYHFNSLSCHYYFIKMSRTITITSTYAFHFHFYYHVMIISCVVHLHLILVVSHHDVASSRCHL